MDTSILQIVTADFAVYLSEVTAGDLGQPIAEDVESARTLGELYLSAALQAHAVAAALGDGDDAATALDQDELLTPVDIDGGGYDQRYRRLAADMTAAFEARAATDRCATGQDVGEVYAGVLVETAARTSVLAAALGLAYHPATPAGAVIGAGLARRGRAHS